ncbi:MAG TPA: aminoacetone oxidase family FAD-binding enzyme [Vicinamibacterales bacterium]
MVGAGAAGLATAILAGRRSRGARFVVFDGAKRPGAKILVSGGGRCNVTNVVVGEGDFWGGRSSIVRRVLRAFPAADAAEFFRRIGVPLHEEEDGKLFPDSNKARDVLDALLRELRLAGATLLADHRVLDVVQVPDGFAIATTRGEYHAHRVVLATGGLSLPKSGSDGAGLSIAERLGHTIVATTPALAPLLLAPNEPLHQELAGVAHGAELSIWTEGRIAIRLRGSMLWTHVGLSGPVALNASRHWLRLTVNGLQPSVTVNMCGADDFDAIDRRVADLARDRPKASLQVALSTLIPASVAAAILNQLAIDPLTTAAHVTRPDRRRLSHALAEWPMPVTGTRGYNHAEATAGGISLAEIDPARMESRVCPGLFLVGEMLDVDGRLGGFNFQWAWSTAYVAARGLTTAILLDSF